MPDTIILRFRDLTNDATVKAHRDIISAAGYVWWGWWKKDVEPDRSGELEELREKARANGLMIGLFDRSSNSFYAGRIVDCAFADRPIASPEPHRTPSYYALKKVPAWFKLTSIEQFDEKAFSRSFGPPPNGDGTFFPIWKDKPARSTNGHSIRLSAPTVLHISDVHLGHDFGFPGGIRPGETPLVDAISRDFDKEKPGLIVVSGDLTTRADMTVLLDDGVKFLRTLADRMHLPPECVVVVPGNHDIALRSYTPIDYSHERVFNLFTKEIYGEAVSFPELRRFKLPDGRSLEVLMMNSVRLRHEKEKQFGYVQWPLYDDVLKAAPADPDGIRMAVLHHHLVAAPREESLDSDYPEAGLSTTLDAGAVIEGLQSHSFNMVLHGHQHVPAVTQVSRGRLPPDANDAEFGSRLTILAAGSAGAKRLADEMRDNSYNILTIGPKEIEIEARRFNKAAPPRRYFRCQSALC